jgi:hypothetical protein
MICCGKPMKLQGKKEAFLRDVPMPRIGPRWHRITIRRYICLECKKTASLSPPERYKNSRMTVALRQWVKEQDATIYQICKRSGLSKNTVRGIRNE